MLFVSIDQTDLPTRGSYALRAQPVICAPILPISAGVLEALSISVRTSCAERISHAGRRG